MAEGIAKVIGYLLGVGVGAGAVFIVAKFAGVL